MWKATYVLKTFAPQLEHNLEHFQDRKTLLCSRSNNLLPLYIRTKPLIKSAVSKLGEVYSLRHIFYSELRFLDFVDDFMLSTLLDACNIYALVEYLLFLFI